MDDRYRREHTVLGRKRAVSVRLHVADLRKIKKISERLGVRDSDVIRYAVKSLLVKLSPIADPSVRGRSLVPVFLEMGRDLTHGFDIDAAQLHEILNEGASPEESVGIDDLHMITMAGEPAAIRAPAGGSDGSANGLGDGDTAGAAIERRTNHVKRYLYEKYVYRSVAAATGPVVRSDD